VIGRISGLLIDKNPPQVLVDAGGVGYDIDVPMSTFYNLPAVGDRVALLTHLIVREDAHVLYGFSSEAERFAFRQLIKVSGVGSRTALAVLSGLNVDELVQAVAAQESGRLLRIPGIGKKTAERLLLELRDKLASTEPALAAVRAAAATPASDVARALIALGYNDREAQAAVRELPADIALQDGIRLALKRLSAR
jgi:Holliday junction DNA helicase RuvA